MPQALVGELVAGTPSDRYRDDQAAVAQAHQVVRQPGPGDLQGIGEVGGMGRGLAQGEKDPAADHLMQGAARVPLVPPG